MKAGAIITIAGEEQVKESACEEAPSQSLSLLGISPVACQEFLGQTLLERTRKRLSDCGIEQQSVLFEQSGSKSLIPFGAQTGDGFFSAWESAVAQQLSDGAEVLFLIRLGAYVEIDFRDLSRFHLETSSDLTQVYGDSGAFDVGIVSADQLRTHAGSYRRCLSALIPRSSRYNFSGYSNRLAGPKDFRRLAYDALTGGNSLRPNGEEVGPSLWLGAGAKVDASAIIAAPAYIGAHTQIKGSCLVQGATAIERDCEIDFGTTITDSCVLPGTYLGMGLNIVHAIASPNRLFNLDRNLGIEVSDPKWIGHSLATSFLGGFAKSIRRKGSLTGASTNLFGTFSHL